MKTIEEEFVARREQPLLVQSQGRREIRGVSDEDSRSRIIELAKSVIHLGIKERARQAEERVRYADIGATMLNGWTGGESRITAAELLSEA